MSLIAFSTFVYKKMRLQDQNLRKMCDCLMWKEAGTPGMGSRGEQAPLLPLLWGSKSVPFEMQ